MTQEKQVSGDGNPLHRRRELTGVVVSDKMTKTITVKVDRQVQHRLYKKYFIRSKKFKAHDEKNTAKTGDVVRIVESRRLSKTKRWALQEIVRKASSLEVLKEQA